MNDSVDVAILGAGISGLSVADACIQKGKTCAVFDIHEPGEGTSGAPGMLVNAATGRRAKKTWEAENGYASIHSFLKRVRNYSSINFFNENSVLRPALTKKLAVNFKKSITKYDWPEGWIEWIDKERVNKEYPYIDNDYGALLIRNGLTVNGQLFLNACSEYLKSNGMVDCYHQKADYAFENEKWRLSTKNGVSVTARYLVDARGFHQAGLKEWDFIPLHNIKGQTATFIYSEPLPLHSSISSLGYMAYMGNYPEKLTVGSTYEHEFQTLEPDEAGLEYLIKKLESTLPDYSSTYKSVKQWSGVRTTVPDRKPVVGPHPDISHFYMIGALGSKGLLLGRYLAEILVKSMFEESDIPTAIDIKRFCNSGG
jgi:glycine/D-amino acid oxidase-like deaminating enzyme